MSLLRNGYHAVSSPTHILASKSSMGTGVGPSITTLVTCPITAEGLSSSTRTKPERSGKVVPVIGGRGWAGLAVTAKALT